MENNTNIHNQEVTKPEKDDYSTNNCAVTNALKIMGGKWKMLLIKIIADDCVSRFGELKRKMDDIAQTTLTIQLRELERDGIIYRKAYAESPPRVEYKLTEIGITLLPVIQVLTDWNDKYCNLTKTADHTINNTGIIPD
ncbi:helix-turn-helix domain-containing protein [Pedobacter gandavensis]|uniref:winged helix-turn-helix transcriptional regulator n=1 Tax=Pedobacter gandavensis TaxID=2679963 RepID=UPI00292D5472|nr:helix-turn-helix domain-containing protein [Pedobacter gandavensis]